MNPEDDIETLEKGLRSYSALWVKSSSWYFGVSERTINRCLSDLYGSVMNADLTVLFLRLASLFTAMADGQITGSPKVDGEIATFYRDLDLDHETEMPKEIRAFNVVLVKFLSGRYKVSISSINRGLHRDFGPVKDADTGQLFTRAAAVLRMCADLESNKNQVVPEKQKTRSGKTHSSEWWDTHKVYLEQAKRAADLYSLKVSAVNSVMYKRRGPIHDEDDAGIAERLIDMHAAFPRLAQGDP